MALYENMTEEQKKQFWTVIAVGVIGPILLLLVPVIFQLILSACSVNTDSKKMILDTLAMETELVITSSNTQVSDFVEENTDLKTWYETDECYDITPTFIADNSDYFVIKYSTSTQSFIMYDDEIYSIGECFGGFGITSMALADLNKDGKYELYYTFSWGSGLHRSQVGYFEPVNKEIHVFDYSLFDFNSDLMLTVNKSGDLCVNTATLDIDNFVNFTIRAQDFIGTVNFEEGEIILNINGQD